MSGTATADRGYGVLERAFRKCEAAAAIVGGVMMLLAMLLTSMDALLRYAFNAPLTFNYYLTENYLMVGMMLLPMAWGFRAGGYIRIMLLVEHFSPTIRNLLLRSGLLVSCVYVAALAWLSGTHFFEVYQRGDVQMGVIDWPVAWSWAPVPVGLSLLAVRLLLTAFGPDADLHLGHDETAENGP
jgi:TRAP-type C4-dicarboxylate transport system permease small subunit